MTLAAGMLHHRVRFERQSVDPTGDGAGNVLQPWALLVERRAAFRPSFGREQVEAGRLESTMLGVLTIRRDSVTAGLTAADRAVFVNPPYAGRALQIRSIVLAPDGASLDLTVEEGSAQ
ncbi:MAG TPA: head-tail adaptor protein [Pirellulaceae bacterium]|nr:head-tail adaptor protein [Pirellulaceae bacterium]